MGQEAIPPDGMVQVREKDDRFQQKRLDTFFRAAPQQGLRPAMDVEVTLLLRIARIRH